MLKDDLIKTVWPDAFVEESNLTQQVSAVRKALGESAGEDRFIVTVPGKGYRFVAAVKYEEAKPPEEPARIVKRKVNPVLAGAGVAIAMMVLGYFLVSRIAHPRPRVLAILPFQNLKHDAENNFLGFSLVDAVITKLGAVRSLTVRASSDVERYRNQAVDIRRVAADLRVDTISPGPFCGTAAIYGSRINRSM